MLLGEPHANLIGASKTVGGLQFDLQCRQGCVGDAPMDRGPGHLRTECLVSTARGIRGKPRGHAVPMHPKQRSNGLAVAGVSTRGPIQGMQPLPFFAVGFTFHASLPFVGAFDKRRHRFSHATAPPFDRDRGA